MESNNNNIKRARLARLVRILNQSGREAAQLPLRESAAIAAEIMRLEAELDEPCQQ